MSDTTAVGPVDEHIAGAPPAARRMLQELRAIISEMAPEAQERIAYGIPTLDLDGRHLVHFAGYANHVSLYPTPSGTKAFEEDLKPYATGKGTIRFRLDRPLPVDLVRRIVEFRVREIQADQAHG